MSAVLEEPCLELMQELEFVYVPELVHGFVPEPVLVQVFFLELVLVHEFGSELALVP